MDCEYSRYGCNTRVSNPDHQQAHIAYQAGGHLKLVAKALENEVEKNAVLSDKVVALETLLKETVDKYAHRFAELELKIKSLQDAEPREARDAKEDTYRPAELKMSNGTNGSSRDIYSSSASTSSSARASSSSSLSSQRSQSSSYISMSSLSSSSTSSPVSSYASSRLAQQQAQDSPNASSQAIPIRPGVKSSTSVITTNRDRGSDPNRPPSRSDAPSPSPGSPDRSRTPLDGNGKDKRGSFVRSATEYVVDKHKSDPGYELARSLTLEDIDGYERGILWGYDPVTQEWSRGLISFIMEKSSFAAGALRAAYKVDSKETLEPVDTAPDSTVVGTKKLAAGSELPSGFASFGNKYVAKISKNKVAHERYFEDVKMQMMCLELGKKFNDQGAPKPVQFLPAWVLEIPTRSPPLCCGLEPFVEGEFVKLSNNYGAVLSDRNTPAAFSHFSWEITTHSYLVIDLQGVKDFYTDPQIHTKDGKGFGLGNLGMNGIERFLKTHKCNAVCQMLNLPTINPDNTWKRKSAVMKGTMKVPYIEDQLGPNTATKWEAPFDMSRGEFQCQQTLTGHEDRVVSLCVTTKHLICGAASGDLRIFNLTGYTLRTSFSAHRKSVECIVANEKNIFTSSADHSIKVWDIETFEPGGVMRDHTGEVNAICLSDKMLGFLVSASFDKAIKVWNVRTLKFMNTLDGHTKAIKALAISGSILFSASNDGCIMMWSLKYMSSLYTIDAHDGWVKSLIVKDRTLFSGAFDYLIKEWDMTNFNLITTLTAHNDDVMGLLATDKFLVSASNDRNVLVWDYQTKKCLYTLKGHRSGVQSLATDGKFIYSGSDDCSVKVWKFVPR